MISKGKKSAWGAGLEYDSATSKWKNSDGSEDAAVNALNIDASFAEKSNAPDLKNGIVMSDTAESTFYAAGEWTEYIALFFNKEKVVKTLVDDVRSKWLCHSANHAKQLAPNTPKPKVLFLEWQNQTYGWGTYKGWEVEACYSCSDGSYPTLGQDFDGSKWQCGLNKIPATKTAAHRYCELIRAAGGEVLNNHVLANPAVALADEATAPANDGVTPFPQGPWKGPAGKGSKSGYSHADLAKVAKDADIIILKTGNCNCAWDTPACTAKQCSDYYANQVFGDASLSQIKAVRNKKVFDMYNSVDPNWGTYYVQAPGLFADVMLEDFIKAISSDTSKTTAAHSLVFLRDNFKANSWGNLYKCGEAGAPSVGCAPTKASLVAKCTQPLISQPDIVSDACPTLDMPVPSSPAPPACEGSGPSTNTTWGRPGHSHCHQPYSWTELIEGYKDCLPDNKIKMGGLGTRLEPDRGYQTWLCLLDHPCGDPSYCWVYHERDQVFTPWGKNSELKLFKT